jgi:fructuronate reductase
MGLDDQVNELALSSDPLLATLKPYLSKIKVGDKDSVGDSLRPILSNEEIFGVNLYDIGLGEKIEDYFKEMILGKGAVRATLQRYV